jgi:CBS domain-containing protein
MFARDIMSDGVMSVASTASVLEAANLLINAHVSAMPVVDEAGHMVGIVSEADLVSPQSAEKTRFFANIGSPAGAADFTTAQSCKVTEVMTRNVITATEDTPLLELARLMTAYRVKRLPVLRGGTVVGLVSRIDLLRALIAIGNSQDPQATKFNRDEELRKQVAAACQGRVWSRAKQLDVVVSAGVAHLWGIAPSDPVRKAYRAAAENVPGIKAVEVHMHVVPPRPMRVGL